jgi:hypothetical protein
MHDNLDGSVCLPPETIIPFLQATFGKQLKAVKLTAAFYSGGQR